MSFLIPSSISLLIHGAYDLKERLETPLTWVRQNPIASALAGTITLGIHECATSAARVAFEAFLQKQCINVCEQLGARSCQFSCSENSLSFDDPLT